MEYGYCSDTYEGVRCEHAASVLVLDMAETEEGVESIDASHFYCSFHAVLHVVGLPGQAMRLRCLV